MASVAFRMNFGMASSGYIANIVRGSTIVLLAAA